MYYIISEFSKFYKRISFLEYSLKHKLVKKYAIIHGYNCYNKIYPYLLKLETVGNKYKHQFSKLKQDGRKNAITKLTEAFEILYLSDTIDLLNEKTFYKDRAAAGFFKHSYTSNNFRNQCKNIKEFRNIISHQNFKTYNKNKHMYIKSLVYFEQMLDLQLYDIDINKFNCGANRPSSKSIVEFIYHENKDIIDDDKKVIDIFDEIAISNGYTIKSLPSRASIIRTKFKVQADSKIAVDN